jgi:hypothetical protein
MKMRRGDKAMLRIFLAILIASGVLWGIRVATRNPEVMNAEITQEGKLLQRILLKKGDPVREIIIRYKGGYNKVRVEDCKISVIEADCPDEECVKRGWLERPGDSAICLPHRLEIRLTGEPEVDGVTY